MYMAMHTKTRSSGLSTMNQKAITVIVSITADMAFGTNVTAFFIRGDSKKDDPTTAISGKQN
jgi:hypothetical protein